MVPKTDSNRQREGGFATWQAAGTACLAPAHEETVERLVEEKPPRAPALYFIIVYKLIKGGLFLTLAVVMYCLSDNDLPQEYQNLMDLLRIHPANRFFANLAVQVGQLTEVKLLWAAVGTLVFSLFSLVEALGLLARVSWASWLAIGESAFFIPIELYELSRHFTVGLALILVVNAAIVWYLYTNRHRLFHHHHHHHPRHAGAA